MAGVPIGEVGVFGEFAAGDEGVPHLVAALVCQDGDIIDPVFDVVAVEADEELVPTFPVDAFAVGGVGRDEVVEGSEGAVAG